MGVLKGVLVLWLLFGSIIGALLFILVDQWLPRHRQDYTRLNVIVLGLMHLIFPAITLLFGVIWLFSHISDFVTGITWKRIYYKNSKLYKWLNGKAFRP